VLLADPGVAPLHAAIEERGGKHWIKPLASVLTASGEALKESTVLAPEHYYQLGGVWIGFFQEGAPWPEWPPTAIASGERRRGKSDVAAEAELPTPAQPGPYPWIRRFAALVLVGIGGVLAIVGIASSAYERRSTPPQRPQEARGSKSAPESPLAAVMGGRTPSDEELIGELKRQMGERDLLQRVDFDFSGGRLEMRGNMDTEEQERFERLLKKFDKTFHPKFEIVARIVPLKDLLPFKIVEVTTGKGANVVTDSGQRLFLGDSLKGYRLAAVESGKVTFSGKRRIEVTW
jgi:type III secretion protein D